MKRFLALFFVAAITSFAAVTEVDTYCGASGGPITTTGTVATQIGIGAHTASSYTVLTGDCGKVLTQTITSAWALPQSGSSGFAAGFYFWIQAIGSGTITVTPATSTFYGAVTGATLTVNPGANYLIVGDGTNYFVMGGSSPTTNGHILFTGAAPTVSDCGVGATVAAGSTDTSGTLTVGKNPDGSARLVCQLTFAATFTRAPAMSFSVSTNGVQVSPGVTTTYTRFRFSGDASGATVSYTAF